MATSASSSATLLKTLVDYAVKGEQFVVPRDASGNLGRIAADDINDLMRGIAPVSLPTSTGLPALRALRLKDCQIIGMVNLAGRREKPLPPMEFEKCVFIEEIRFCGAWLTWFRLKDCKILHLRGEECKVDGSMILDGVESSAKPAGLLPSVGMSANPQNALSPSPPVTASPKEEPGIGAAGLGLCWVELQNAVIGGDLRVRSSRLCAPSRKLDFSITHGQRRFALNLSAIKIDGSLIAEPRLQAVGGVSISNCRISGDVRMSGANLVAVESAALFGQNCNIGANLVLSKDQDQDGLTPFRTVGGISLFGGQIGGAFHMEGALVTFARDQSSATEDSYFALRARYLVVRDHAVIEGSFAGPVEFAHARIGADCALGLELIGNDKSGRLMGLKNSTVKGSLNIDSLTFDDPLRRLSDSITQVSKVKKRKLRCYQGWYLVEIELKTGCGLATAHVLWDGAREVIPLTGSSQPFHRLNARGLLTLQDSLVAVEYLRLFSSTIKDDQYGVFFIMADAQEAGSVLREHLGKRPQLIAVIDDAKKSFTIEADVIYGSVLYRARFEVPKETGKVEMVAENPDPSLIVTSTYFDSPFRRDLDPLQDLPPLFPAVEWEMLDVTEGTELLRLAVEQSTFFQVGARAEFDLTGATAKRLEDNGGEGIGRSVLLKLEGFRYEQLGKPASDSQYIPEGRDVKRILRPFALMLGVLGSMISQMSRVLRTFRHFLKSPTDFFLRLRFPTVILDWIQRKELRPWQKRLNWLALQYPNSRIIYRSHSYEVQSSIYSPQPFDQLAAVFRSQGEFIDARKILSRKLTIERRFKRHSLFRFTWWLYWLGFDYGLSPGRALITLFLFLCLGAVAAGYASRNGLLVTDVPVGAATSQAVEHPCAERKLVVLYVIEIFIPAADLKLEPKCHIRIFDPKRDKAWSMTSGLSANIRIAVTTPHLCQIGEFMYRFLGIVIVSLAVLTFTGVARRHLEK